MRIAHDGASQRRTATFTQKLLHAANGEALIVKQVLDAVEQLDIFRPVITAATATLERTYLLELAETLQIPVIDQMDRIPENSIPGRF